MATYTWDYGAAGSGLHFTIVFDTSTNKFTVSSHEGSFDLNALWWGDDEADGAEPTLSKADNSLNMNGANTVWDDQGNATSEDIDWDGYQKLSKPGLGTEGEDKSSFISEGETEEFCADQAFIDFVASLNGADFTLGVRATSVNGDGSIKFADTDPEYDDGTPPQGSDDFPEWPQDISNVVLVFDTTDGDTKPIEGKVDGSGSENNPDKAGYPINPNDPQDGDGYYTVKIDNWPDNASDDLDNSIDEILAYLIANDPNVDAETELLGVVIKGGNQADTEFFAYGDNNLNGTDPDPLPDGIGFELPGDSGNVDPPSAIDQSYDYADVFA